MLDIVLTEHTQDKTKMIFFEFQIFKFIIVYFRNIDVMYTCSIILLERRGNIKSYTVPQTCTLTQHNNKLHILSPISDKSSQEPISETSDNNRNNNSQKCSPEEVATNQETLKTKRRLPQNKNLLNLANPEIQGSDSGISIQSREGMYFVFYRFIQYSYFIFVKRGRNEKIFSHFLNMPPARLTINFRLECHLPF